jgi:hypothetical protein
MRGMQSFHLVYSCRAKWQWFNGEGWEESTLGKCNLAWLIVLPDIIRS